MFEPVDRMSLVPIYEQVADQLRKMIDGGVYRPGQHLPPENTLAASFGVGVDCLRDGLQILVGEGRVSTARGTPARVREPAAVRDLRLQDGDRVHVRMPSRPEARKHRMEPGVPLMVIHHCDGTVGAYPADRYVILR